MRISSVSLVAAALVAAGLMTAPASARERALVIGINDYPFLTENGAKANRNLEVAVADAQRFNAFLINDWGMPADSVRMLTDSAATRDGIISNFEEWLIDGTGPGDRVVFYYSGHGFQSEDISGDEPDDPFDEGLAPHDTSGDLATGKLDNILIDDTIGELIARLQGREVWIVVDACFAGTITRSASVSTDGRSTTARARTLTPRGPVRVASRSLASETAALAAQKTKTRLLKIAPADAAARGEEKDISLFAWTATTSAQLAFERSDIGGGVFTTAFVEGLKNKTADFDGDEQVTAAELLTFVRQRSEEFCESEPMCREGSGLTPEVIAPKEHFASVLAPPLFAGPGVVVPVATPPEEPGEVETPPDEPEVVEGPPEEPEVVEGPPEEPEVVEGPPEGPEVHEGPGEGPPPPVVIVEESPAQTASGLFTHHNDFPIEVEILPGNDLYLGQEVVIRVTSAEPGYLILFDQGPDGELSQIFPNEHSIKHHKDGLILPGRPIAIPDQSYGFAFEMTEPGDSVLLALVVSGEIEFGDLLAANQSFDIIADPNLFLAEIAQYVLSASVTVDPNVPNGRNHWAFATVRYYVE